MKNNNDKFMNVLGIIPARGGSIGIPKKNLIKINKKPLLYYTINTSILNWKIIRRKNYE